MRKKVSKRRRAFRKEETDVTYLPGSFALFVQQFSPFPVLFLPSSFSLSLSLSSFISLMSQIWPFGSRQSSSIATSFEETKMDNSSEKQEEEKLSEIDDSF